MDIYSNQRLVYKAYLWLHLTSLSNLWQVKENI